MNRRFGAEYDQYRVRVRRWLQRDGVLWVIRSGGGWQRMGIAFDVAKGRGLEVGVIQVAVTEVSPGSERLCAYKSGFNWRNGLLLHTPLGSLGLAPVAARVNYLDSPCLLSRPFLDLSDFRYMFGLSPNIPDSRAP